MATTRQKYITITTVYQLAGWYNVELKCNGFMATNIGDRTCLVNDQLLFPGTPGTVLGDSRTWGGNAGEIYVGQIKVEFQGVGVAPAIEIVQKVFVD